MNIALSDETEGLIEEQMKRRRFQTPDDLMQEALRRYAEQEAVAFEDLDPETRAAIDEAEAQIEGGEGRPRAEVRAEILSRFVKA